MDSFFKKVNANYILRPYYAWISNCFYNKTTYISFLKIICLFWKSELQRKRIFHPPVQSSDAHNGQSDQGEPGVWNPLQTAQAGGKDPDTQASTCCLPGYTPTGSGIGSGAAMQTRALRLSHGIMSVWHICATVRHFPPSTEEWHSAERIHQHAPVTSGWDECCSCKCSCACLSCVLTVLLWKYLLVL